MGSTKSKIFTIWLFAVRVHRPLQEQPREHWDRHKASRAPASVPEHTGLKAPFKEGGVCCTALGGRGCDWARRWRPALRGRSGAARLKGALGATLFCLWLAGRKGGGGQRKLWTPPAG